MDSDENQNELKIFAIRKIYDPILRILHAWNGICIIILIISILIKNLLKPFPNGSEILYRFHVYIGFALTGGILIRVLWGIIGAQNARWKSMIFLRDWINVIKTKKLDNSDHWGHDRYASLVYLLFYLSMIYQSISGLILAAKVFGMGPFSFLIVQTKEKIDWIHIVKEAHEFVYYFSMIYIVIHITMIKIHEIKNKHPVAQSMFNGYQYRNPKK